MLGILVVCDFLAYQFTDYFFRNEN